MMESQTGMAGPGELRRVACWEKQGRVTYLLFGTSWTAPADRATDKMTVSDDTDVGGLMALEPNGGNLLAR